MLTFGRYLFERGDFHAARPLLHQALLICRANPTELIEVLADNLFSLSALSIQINADQTVSLNYGLEHYEIRLKLDDGTPFSKDRLAMAYGEVGQVYMIMGQYEKAIEHSEIAIKITEKSPR